MYIKFVTVLANYQKVYADVCYCFECLINACNVTQQQYCCSMLAGTCYLLRGPRIVDAPPILKAYDAASS
jgi:hypothetical protein